LLDHSLFAGALNPRPRDSHKGSFGHVLVVGGANGKTGAAAMAGLAALRAGAGLVTVACDEPNLTSFAPELMSSPLPGDLSGKTVVAAGPGLGTTERAQRIVRDLIEGDWHPLVLDADALNILAGSTWKSEHLTVLTPHPGEAARLLGTTTQQIQADRIGAAFAIAKAHNAITVLKGQRSLIAFPDGKVWINPTGTPAMATGGSGDILTGLIAGWLGITHQPIGVACAVYLHGLAGEKAAAALGESTVIATDILRFLPDALRDLQDAL
jgi:NAD(P)H-hydrate epimerase